MGKGAGSWRQRWPDRSSAVGLVALAGSRGQVLALLKESGKLDIRRGQPCGADTQTKQTCSGVSMTPKYQLSSPGCPGPCSVACSPSAVCGLFTLWVLPVSWENIPGLAERCNWKEKDVPALSVFLCISRYGKGSGVAVSGEAKCLCLCRAPVHQQFLSGLWKWKGRI